MWSVLFSIAIAIWGVALAIIDARTYRLPNVLTLSGLAIILIVVLITHDWWALLGGLVWAGIYSIIGAFSGGIGGGDIKLAPSLGILIGSAGVLPVLVAIGITQGLFLGYSFTLRRDRIPHGPAMLLATAIVWLLWPAARLLL